MSHVVFLMRFQYETAELAELWNVIQMAKSSYLFLSDREKQRYRAETREKKSPSIRRKSTKSQRWKQKELSSSKSIPPSPSKMSSVGIFDEKESIKDKDILNTQTDEHSKQNPEITTPKPDDAKTMNEESKGKEKSIDRKIDELPDLLTLRKERAENRRKAADEKKRALEEENVKEKAHIELAKQISLQPPTKTSNFDQQACSSKTETKQPSVNPVKGPLKIIDIRRTKDLTVEVEIEEGGRSRVKLLEKLNLDEINEVIMECSREMKKYSKFIDEVRKQKFKLG